jgi:protein MAK11
VKAFQTLDIALPEASGRTSTTIISTVSSDGKIRVFDMHDIPNYTPTSELVEVSAVAEYDTNGTRLTCVTLADADAEGETIAPAVGKRKRTAEDSDSDGEGSEGDADDDAQFGEERQEEEQEELEEEIEEEDE